MIYITCTLFYELLVAFFSIIVYYEANVQYTTLGETALKISKLCLGTMTWGQQNSEAEAHQQLDCALSHGINFIDTAELYPVPPQSETQGRTEEYLGSWLSANGTRHKVVVATKVAGPSSFEWVRDGERPRLNAAHIRRAVEGSLRRLKTDYIDLYQLHWPERATNYFGALNYTHTAEDDAIPLSETLAVLQELITEGSIRYIGLSNETPWGLLECIRLHQVHGLPRVHSVQNPYSLLNRSYEVGMAEISIRERCGLLPYSVLGFGTLTGKYLSTPPASGRITEWPEHFGRYSNPRATEATARYVALASEHRLSPTELALAFVVHQPFVTSTIIGATTLQQLQQNITAGAHKLTPHILEEINAIEQLFPYPAP